MTRTIITAFFTCFCLITHAQQQVQWSYDFKELSPGKYIINVTATATKGWYIYAENKATDLAAPTIKWNDSSITVATTKYAGIIKKQDDVVFGEPLDVYLDKLQFSQVVEITGAPLPRIKGTIAAFTSNGREFIPVEHPIVVQTGETKATRNALQLTNVEHPLASCGDDGKESTGLLSLFFLGFLGGLIALLTPCVFPMVPVTVSFFTNRSSTKQQGIRNGILYGVFIILIYFLVSIPFHLITNLDPQSLNTISTNVWMNLFFFAVFMFFAFSFFGFYEITLPGNLGNIAGNKSNLTSKMGIFFMAVTLVIVSFSCTGPILGSLLVNALSSDAGAWQLTVGMTGFGVALALPFALFAMFPQWLKRLPKSGGWLDVVKKVLAFIELGLAFKFLSNADLVEHWGILKREVFIGIWLLITLGLGAYLFGWLRLPHDTKGAVSKGRRFTGVVTVLFALYLVPGLTHSKYANLKLLSGFPPPLNYSIYGKEKHPASFGVEPDVVNDYEAALKLSKQLNKPLMIDFTGWACVNCRKMEEQVWTDEAVAREIKEKFILVSLYVDDRKKLKPKEQFEASTANGDRQDVTTLGEKWAFFQSENFKQVTQPLYVLLSPDEELLNKPVGYTPDAEDYIKWMQCGLRALESKQSKTVQHAKPLPAGLPE